MGQVSLASSEAPPLNEKYGARIDYGTQKGISVLKMYSIGRYIDCNLINSEINSI